MPKCRNEMCYRVHQAFCTTIALSFLPDPAELSLPCTKFLKPNALNLDHHMIKDTELFSSLERPLREEEKYTQVGKVGHVNRKTGSNLCLLPQMNNKSVITVFNLALRDNWYTHLEEIQARNTRSLVSSPG